MPSAADLHTRVSARMRRARNEIPWPEGRGGLKSCSWEVNWPDGKPGRTPTAKPPGGPRFETLSHEKGGGHLAGSGDDHVLPRVPDPRDPARGRPNRPGCHPACP